MSCLFYILMFPLLIYLYVIFLIIVAVSFIMDWLCYPLKWLATKLYSYYTDQNLEVNFFKLGEFSFANPNKDIFKYNKTEHNDTSKYREYSKKNIETDFDKEADLWGLTEEERRIAKEERMSPADFVEAEEYDDDELLLDEWER